MTIPRVLAEPRAPFDDRLVGGALGCSHAVRNVHAGNDLGDVTTCVSSCVSTVMTQNPTEQAMASARCPRTHLTKLGPKGNKAYRYSVLLVMESRSVRALLTALFSVTYLLFDVTVHAEGG